MTSRRHAFIRFSLNKFWCHVWRDVSFRLSWWLDLERQEESALEATQEALTTCPGVYAISCYSEIMQWSLNQTKHAWPREVTNLCKTVYIYIINTIINHVKHTFEVLLLCLKGLLLEICSARKSNQSRCLRQFRSRPGSIWQKSLEILGIEQVSTV